MRWGRFIGGVVLLLIGVLLLVAGFVVNGGSTTLNAPAGDAIAIQPNAVTSEQFSVQWQAGVSTAAVYLVSGSVACPPSSGITDQGSGASGAFTTTLTPGAHYFLFACNGTTPIGATFTYSASGGITVLEIVAIVLVILSAPLLYFGVRRSARSTDTVSPYGSADAGTIVSPAPPPFYEGSAPPATSPPVTSAAAPAALPPPSYGGRTMKGCVNCGRASPYTASVCEGCGQPI